MDLRTDSQDLCGSGIVVEVYQSAFSVCYVSQVALDFGSMVSKKADIDRFADFER